MPGPVTLLRYDADELRLNHEVRPARHEGPQGACHEADLELCLIESGAEESMLGRTRTVPARGQYVLIPPGVEHSSRTLGRGVRECIVHLSSARLDELAEQLGLRSSRTWRADAFRTFAALEATVGALRRELSSAEPPAGRALLVGSLVTQIGVLLLRRHGAATAELAPGSTPARLRRVEERMRASPGDAFTLDELAKLAGMSRWGFLRAFKLAYGLPPYAYLLRLRVEEAARRMQQTDLPLTLIAHELGFGSSSRLTEAFRRVHGEPPSRWRRERATSGK